MVLLHITHPEAINSDWKIYAPESLAQEGFIHFSTVEQILDTANRFYRSDPNLLVLVVDPEKLTAEVRYENLEGGGTLFPHLYGPLNRQAVLKIVRLLPDSDGYFEQLPSELEKYARS